MQEFRFEEYFDGTYAVMSYEGDEPDVVIPAQYGGMDVTVLGDDLFKGHSEIRSVKIPDCVRAIGSCAFDGRDQLHEIRLPESLEDMWQYAFARSGIETIILTDRIRSIVPFTFKDCERLKTVICNSGLKEICAWAFDGCGNLDEVVFGPGVKVSPLAFSSLGQDRTPFAARDGK